jgi:hypothetical protein
MKAMGRGFLPTPQLQEDAGTDEFRDKYGKQTDYARPAMLKPC